MEMSTYIINHVFCNGSSYKPNPTFSSRLKHKKVRLNFFNIFLSISYDLKYVTCKCEMKIYCKNKLKNDIALMIDKNNIDVELFLNIFKELIFGQLYFAGFFKFSKNIYF